MTGIRGKVVAITGASSGIGEAISLLAAEHGASVVLGARRADRLDALASRISESGGSVAHTTTDVTRRADLENLVEVARDSFGRLDVLISNAGIGPISPMDSLRVDDWDAMIDVNLRGVLYGIAAALPVFREQGSGHFVNTVSTAGLQIVPDMAVYAATKNAVRTLSEGLRQEAGADLRVTVVSPGMTATPFSDSMTDPDIRAQMAETQQSLGIEPAAIARAMAFAIAQPFDVDVGDIVVRPTAQG